jgi:signal transduction histidine kinase
MAKRPRGSDTHPMPETGQKKRARTRPRATGDSRSARRNARPTRSPLAAQCEELRAQLDRADRAKRELLSVVSHDLRNPLSVILVSARLLSRSLRSDPSATRQLEAVTRAGEEINRLIQELVDAHQIERGSFEVIREAQRMDDLVERALSAAAPMCARKQVELRRELQSELPTLLGDGEKLVQSVGALIDNALKFTPKGGHITVRVTGAEGELHLSVSDDGPGVLPDQPERIFSRESHQVRPVQQGVGLSMYVAKGVVEAHGGRVWAESAPGAGCTFHAVLPCETHAALRAG